MKRRTKIRKGDTVEVVTGRRVDKGRRGEVIKVLPKQNRVVVQGINMLTKHQRQFQSEGRTMSPGIIEFEGSLDLSNVMFVCPDCSEATRVGYGRDEDGIPFRICKKCGAEVD